MKQIVKILFVILVSLFFVLVGFYFWASSPNLSNSEYSEIETNEFTTLPENNHVYSIVTYNIGYLSGMTNNLPVEKPKSLFEQNLNKVIYELKKVNADIVALQEIDYDSDRSYNIDQQNELARLGYNYTGKNINWDKKYVPFPYYPFSMHFGKLISGQSILSKYEILSQERIELKRNPDNIFYYDSFYIDRLAQVIKLKIDYQTLIIINVHLEAFHQKTRVEQMQKIKELYLKYYTEFPTILLGDFNSDIRFEESGIKLLLDLPDTGCAAFDKLNPQNTFDSETPSERLDYIFYNELFIQEVSAQILTQFGLASDHLPLQMKFKFKDKQYGTFRNKPNS